MIHCFSFAIELNVSAYIMAMALYVKEHYFIFQKLCYALTLAMR
jgi:hypothetical protein